MAYTDNIDQPKWKNRVAWGAQGLLALAFLAAGSQKIIGTEPMLQMFAAIGLGPLFQYVTGSLEITGAVMLLIPATAFWGAALVSCIMVGAIYTHLAVIGGSFVPALMLLLLACIVLWVRNPGRTQSKSPAAGAKTTTPAGRIRL
ncbi:DoxX family protein [Oceaniradius stylonematis]|uniref:DoxX family protein n=2 Tax=Oceaniradius stylonematis TaxID=2184161 RepID=A0A3A8AJ64_9HYPH|nr:DoxX family protein [Oceaniradius stylonematis]RKF07720.1 DoxX family protein [Oceaniradius stylonematis]